MTKLTVAGLPPGSAMLALGRMGLGGWAGTRGERERVDREERLVPRFRRFGEHR